MLRMPARRLCCLSAALAFFATVPGCSESAAPPIDTKAAILKATGGDGNARQSAKVKATSEDAAKSHPKLY